MEARTCAAVTYSALELGASEPQAACGEDRLTSLLLLHHGEAVPVSPAQTHQVSPSYQSPSSVNLSASGSGTRGGGRHPSFVQ